MSKHVHPALTILGLGIMVAGCQGFPGFLGPLAGPADGGSPFGSSGIIANNAASLSGQVLAPSSLVANNSAALVGNNSAALVSNNAAAYRTAAVQELPVIKAVVEAVRDGQVVDRATTDETGKYTLSSLTKEKAYLLRVTFNLDGQAYQELAIAKTLAQQTGPTVNSASTLVTAKVLTQGTALEQVNMARYFDTVNLVASAQSAIERSALTSTQASSDAFDQVSLANEQVSSSFTAAVTPTTTSPSPTPTPSQDPATTTYVPKEYFFPPSATARGTFLTTETLASAPATVVSTSSFTVAVTVYTPTTATLVRTILGAEIPSTLQVSGGIVKIDNTFDMGTPVFTTEGGTVTPYGATESLHYKLLAASEQITVPAGTFTCVKLLETTKQGTVVTKERALWYAKNVGIGPVKALTVSESDGEATTLETVLRTFSN